MKPKFTDYSFEVKPLSDAEGGGFLITFPDLPGCMSDGETPEEAIENGKDAFDCWMGAQVEWGRPIPSPFSTGMPGKFVQRVPKSLHAKLAALAKQEGVSINTLVLSFIAEGVGMEKAYAGKAEGS
ncbi:MAG: type II toxin-antitoxin system HicB family antitoxin [Syntrophales bacterium]|nr:type II toxin-antitoxin system HicB family antitoxin [Syntrophales bacterium]